MVSIVLRRLLFLALLLCAQAAHALVFAVNEGVTYQNSREEISNRYAGLAADLSKVLKQPVSVEVVNDYPSLRKGLAERRYDMALIHPTHVGIEALRRSSYRLVAVVRGYQNYQAHFLVDAGSGITSLSQLRGLHLGAPDADSITSVLMRATLRDAGLGSQDVKLTYTRYQDAVPFFIENGLTQAGASASSKVIKTWKDKGGKIVATSRAVPIKLVIGGGQLTEQQLTLVREHLLQMDRNEEGRKRLETIRYPGFDAYEETALLALGTWLGI